MGLNTRGWADNWARQRRSGLWFSAVLCAGSLSVTTPSPAAPTDCGTGSLSVAQARAAVEFVRVQVHDAHWHAPLNGADPAVQALTRLLKSLSAPLTAAELARRTNMALAEDRDGHLRLEFAPDATAACFVLPLTLEWTDDGLLVLPGGPIPAGARVVSIGSHSLEDLQVLAAQSTPHENLYWARSTFARQIARVDMLAALGLAARDGSVEVVYEPPQGSEARVRLKPARPKPETRPWIGYQIFTESSTGVLRLDRCDPTEEFFSVLAAFMREVKQKDLRKVAVDLRGNPGGDSSVALAVLGSLGLHVEQGFSVDVRVSAQLLHDMPMFDPASVAPAFQAAGLAAPAADAREYLIPGPMVLGLLAQRLGDRTLEVVPGRDFYVLTNGGTFSSAALFAALVRDNHLGSLVGEPTGNSVTFNGSEIERPIPGLPYTLHLSTARLLRPDRLAGPSPTLLPDLRAPQTPAALSAGRDAAVERIRNL